MAPLSRIVMGRNYEFYVNPSGIKVTVPPGWKGIFDSNLDRKGFKKVDFVHVNKEGDPKKILVERNTGGLGDILMIQPAVRQLAENTDLDVTVSFPGHYFWMFRDINVRFVDCYTFCQNYLENRKPYGIAFDLMCPYIDYKSNNYLKPKKNRIEVFAESMGVEPKLPELPVNTRFYDKRFKNGVGVKVGLVLEVADRTRPYPLDRWVQVANKLKTMGFRPITIARSKSIHGIEHVVGLSMERLVSIIDQMDFVVTADTGPLHIAAILNKKTIGLFGATNGALICKMYPTVKVLQHLKGPTPCYRPCYGNMDLNNYCCGELIYSTCMYEITSDEVVNAIVQES